MTVKTVEKFEAIMLKPKIARSKKVTSPKTMPTDIITACEKPELRVLETTAKTPGPGVAIKINKTPTKVKMLNKSNFIPLVSGLFVPKNLSLFWS